jgi:hypothetical protein
MGVSIDGSEPQYIDLGRSWDPDDAEQHRTFTDTPLNLPTIALVQAQEFKGEDLGWSQELRYQSLMEPKLANVSKLSQERSQI